ncbi:MAG TPA: sialidase family protein [Candidatus Hydrogenedentes bacterium]|mgnify:CR=1 FL=1|nr:sialidase family protein [Candidatus Hydrogenedentota bacterium]
MPRWFLPIAAIALAMHFSALAVEEKGDDPALAAPPIIMNPGPEYADSTRLFQGIPGIERAPNGRLWATWYAGGDNEGPLNYCALATSGDDGKTWSSVQIAIDPPGDVRAFDPCLWHDPSGRLWWFWAQGFSLWDGRAGVWAITTDNSGDASPVWSEPRRLCDGIMMNKPTVTRSGEWLLPVAIWEFPARVMKEEYAHDITAGTGSNVWISRDQGATFELLGRPDVEGRACDEHMIIERNDGSLWVLVRTRTGLGEAISTDGGRTWTEHIVAETVTHIPHARFFIRRLASGRLLFVKHDPPDQKTRSHLTAFLSDDDGKSWYGGYLIDERGAVSYPDAVQAPDGTLYLIYDWQRTGAREILMAVFREEDVAAGKPVSEAVRFRVLVNKAYGKKEFDYSANSDGQDFLTGERATLEGALDTFKEGALLFTDRQYTALALPGFLQGRIFIRGSIEAVSAVCARSGLVYALTPLPNRNRDSVSEALVAQGFVKVKSPEFLLFGAIPGNIVSVFQKRVEEGETLTLGKWGILVF